MLFTFPKIIFQAPRLISPIGLSPLATVLPSPAGAAANVLAAQALTGNTAVQAALTAQALSPLAGNLVNSPAGAAAGVLANQILTGNTAGQAAINAAIASTPLVGSVLTSPAATILAANNLGLGLGLKGVGLGARIIG